jgi:hypothetical protein
MGKQGGVAVSGMVDDLALMPHQKHGPWKDSFLYTLLHPLSNRLSHFSEAGGVG